MSPESLPLKKLRKRSSKALEDDHYTSSSPSLTSLPEEIIINCLTYVPRSYDINLSFVSKTLNSLIHSPELHRLRSLLPKKNLYLSLRKYAFVSDTTYRWYTLCQIEKTEKNEVEYELVRNPVSFPSHPFMYRSSTVVVGSNIYYIGGSDKPSKELWILDTKSGEFTQGPNMKVARTYECVAEEIDGKIYVIGGCEDKIQVEIFDTRSRSWKVGESPEERLEGRLMIQVSASSNGKVYVAETGSIAVYDPREGGRRMEKLEMPSNTVWFMCVVDDVLYAWYFCRGLMWFDVKGKVWRKVADGGCLERLNVKLNGAIAAEYDGKLAIFWPDESEDEPEEIEVDESEDEPEEIEVWCSLIALKWVGEQIHGTVEWHGSLGLTPDDCTLHKCLAISV